MAVLWPQDYHCCIFCQVVLRYLIFDVVSYLLEWVPVRKNFARKWNNIIPHVALPQIPAAGF